MYIYIFDRPFEKSRGAPAKLDLSRVLRAESLAA